MDDLLGDFVAETRETLEALSGEIVAWELAPDDRSRLDAIFRFVHTVKGSCGFLDLPRLEKLSHAAEDVLADVRADRRRPDSTLVSAVLAVIDRIAELTDAIESGQVIFEADDSRLIAALQPGAVPTPVTVELVAAEPDSDDAALAEALAAIQIGDDADEDGEGPVVSEAPAASSGPVATTAPSTPRAVSRTIRLPVDLLDRMMAGVSDMVLARNELARRLRESGTESNTEVAFERLSHCIAEMRDAITRTRMARVEHLFTALPRMVRDISAELGKTVQLEIDGGDVELDREMIEMIRDPLTHIVRNAIDHGIEAPEARILAGKPMAGRLHVSARQVGNQILIEVIDDGRGIDADRLVQKAVAVGILSQERAATLNCDRKLELIFEPGLSTAQQVTAISGRGVGMDVVRANVERIGGLVDIDSKPGHGLRLTLRVPLTLTIIPALTISAGGQHFAIPRSAIDEIVRIGGDAVRMGELGGADIVFIRGARIPVVSLGGVLGLEKADQTNLVVLKLSGGARYALAVEAVHDHEELVVKPAAPVVMACGIYGGTTLPDNSRPMLLLDVAGVAEKAGVRRDEKGAAEPVAEDNEEEQLDKGAVPVLLFRDLDGIERGVPLALVERIEDCFSASVSHSAGRMRLNIDGRLVPLVSCGAPIVDAKVRVLRMRDGGEELAYAIDSVIDIVPVTIELQRTSVPGPVAGVMLVEERPVEFIDAFWLFAQGLGTEPEPEKRPVCLLSDDDPWTRQVLAPLVESAGYQIIYSPEEGPAADLVIMADSSTAAAPGEAAAVLRLRQNAEERGASPNSLWRYDRIGLTAELRRHWNKRSA